jgi:hypothetical protein
MTASAADWRKLWNPVRELLWREWNPLPASAEDEYDTYIMQVIGKIINGASPEEIAVYLGELDEELMGPPNREINFLGLAKRLVVLRELA